MVKKRTSGGGLGVILAQHFDTGISRVRRLTGELVARFDKIGTDNDPKVVTGTIGRRMGSFLLQLVASPSTRPAYGHLWGLGGVAAIHNGDGTATPILDAWANKDTDIAALTVDVGTQSVSAGDFGVIMRGSNDDAQSLVFLKGGSGSGGGGGGGGDFGDGSNGAIVCDTTNSLDPTFFAYNVGTGIPGHTLKRDLYCTTLLVTGGSWLVTGGYRVFATQSITVDTGCYLVNGYDGGVSGFGTSTTGAGYILGNNTVLGGGNGVGVAGASSVLASWGGNGGAGGAGGGSAGGAGGTVGPPSEGATNGGGHAWSLGQWAAWGECSSGTLQIRPSIGGAGGGSGGVAAPFSLSGRGGQGGGVLVFAAPSVTNNGAITANGYPGANAVAGSPGGAAGGGGGGGGGVVVGFYKTITGNAPTVSGGAGGTGVLGGASGSSGVSGLLIPIVAT